MWAVEFHGPPSSLTSQKVMLPGNVPGKLPAGREVPPPPIFSSQVMHWKESGRSLQSRRAVQINSALASGSPGAHSGASIHTSSGTTAPVN